MKVTEPSYYSTFRCLAGACPDSCCHEWEIFVDGEAAGRYRALSGELGDRLRQVLKAQEDGALMANENGRCPMWREDGLCRIQAELGEDALCGTCRDFPRLRHDYGDFVELGLELSCPEAARWILADTGEKVTREMPGGRAEYDGQDMQILLHTRQQALELVRDESRPVNEMLALLLAFGYHAQSELDSGEIMEFTASVDGLKSLAKPGGEGEFLAFFQGLELLTQRWKQRLAHPEPEKWQKEYRSLARYFVERYYLQAISDFDVACRVKFCVISCLMIRLLGGDLLQTAQLYSKEIENSAENVDALLDGAYEAQALTDDRILGMLLENR